MLEKGPLYVNGCIGRMLLTIFSRDTIASIYKIIHLLKCADLDRASVPVLAMLSDIENQR